MTRFAELSLICIVCTAYVPGGCEIPGQCLVLGKYDVVSVEGLGNLLSNVLQLLVGLKLSYGPETS